MTGLNQFLSTYQAGHPGPDYHHPGWLGASGSHPFMYQPEQFALAHQILGRRATVFVKDGRGRTGATSFAPPFNSPRV
jgi:hypothetical protein